MQALYPRCAGLDVHRDTIVVCARLAAGRDVQHHLQTFSTTTSGLLELIDWLHGHEVTQVAMEATGVLVLANAAHVKTVPGRKTDVKDAQWLSDLLAHDLMRDSFVPPAPVKESGSHSPAVVQARSSGRGFRRMTVVHDGDEEARAERA